MEANELRIGNYFQWSELASMAHGIDKITNCNKIMEYIEFKKPIPITDKWLKKFGFENRLLEVFNQNGKILEIEFDGTENDIYQTQICTYEHICVDGEIESDKVNYLSLNHIKYVHQLQNLYFALTGQELEYK